MKKTKFKRFMYLIPLYLFLFYFPYHEKNQTVKEGTVEIVNLSNGYSLSAKEGLSSQDMLDELTNYTSKNKNRRLANNTNKKGLKAHRKKRYKKSEKIFYEAAMQDSSWEKPFFNLACSTALQRKYGIAIEYLKLAFLKNPRQVLKWAKSDGDLRGIRNRSEFKELIARYQPKKRRRKLILTGNWSSADDENEMTSSACLELVEDGSMVASTHCNYGISCKGTWRRNSNEDADNIIEMRGTCQDLGDTSGDPDIKSGGPFRTTADYDKETDILSFNIKPKHSGDSEFNLKKDENDEHGCGCNGMSPVR